MSMWTVMDNAAVAFGQIDGVQSTGIGIEENVSPADFPLIRIEPATYTTGRPYGNRTGQFNVIFGMPYTPAEGLRTVYEKLHELEPLILAVIRDELGGKTLRTEWFDRRQNVAYKLAAIVCELTG